jgi:hypothetical protein
MRVIRTLAFFALLAGAAYFFREPLTIVAAQLSQRVMPCLVPISYSVDSFDGRFGISKEDFRAAIEEAEAIWEESSGRELFQYSPDPAPLKISLVYDVRQETTQTLSALGVTLENTRDSYDALKERFETMRSDYQSKKAAFDARYATYTRDQAQYERDVRYWNTRGGAPDREYLRLQNESTALKSRSNALQAEQKSINALVADLNALAEALNTEARTLNLNIARYNKIGETGGEFEEAVYESSPGSQKINVYEFSSRDKLVRVLAHELGHALGLDHVQDQNAIMYRVNQSERSVASESDLGELERVCMAKPS